MRRASAIQHGQIQKQGYKWFTNKRLYESLPVWWQLVSSTIPAHRNWTKDGILFEEKFDIFDRVKPDFDFRVL